MLRVNCIIPILLKGVIGFVKYKSRSRYAEGNVGHATCQSHNTDFKGGGWVCKIQYQNILKKNIENDI
jgi:hypothetical protein